VRGPLAAEPRRAPTMAAAAGPSLQGHRGGSLRRRRGGPSRQGRSKGARPRGGGRFRGGEDPPAVRLARIRGRRGGGARGWALG
jgi:hypothetical protein